ncbi:MAG TPA: D-aminoacylase [Acidobacteriota bacterium]|jgi:N-acyl-D-amino-acid deacylase
MQIVGKPVTRRVFLGQALLVAPAAGSWLQVREKAGCLLTNACVIDGSGQARYQADVLIEQDRVQKIGKIGSAPGVEVIDLEGRCLAPGFIDIHTHTDSQLPINPHAESKLRQGVTTELSGNCGSSAVPSRLRNARTFQSYFAELEALPLSINYASLVGHGSLRAFVMGEENRAPTARELSEMKQWLDSFLREGAFGLSSGLEYTPGSFATLRELAALNGVTARHGALYATHMRNEGDALLEAIKEALEVSHRSGARLQISHLKTEGKDNWSKIESALQLIESARRHKVDVHFDRYPYIAFSTGLETIFPLWIREGGDDAFVSRLKDDTAAERARPDVESKIRSVNSWNAYIVAAVSTQKNKWTEGKSLQEVGDTLKIAPFEAARHLIIEEDDRVSIVAFAMNEENLIRFLKHPLSMVGSDGNALAADGPLAKGRPHPRSYGTFPRVLGLYVRERKALKLEDAIKKMTSLPAEKIGLKARGRIQTGYIADLVVFDPEKIADVATFENPHRYAAGIDYVFVNGICALRKGEINPQKSGQVLRRSKV